MERFAGQIASLLILGTIFGIAVTQRILDQVVDYILISHPGTATGRGCVVVVGNLATEQEADTGGIRFSLAFQDRTGKGNSTQEVVVAVNGTTQLDGAVEITRSGLSGNDREGGTITVLGRNTALDQLSLLDGRHGDATTTADGHTIDDGFLTVGTVTTDGTHGTINTGHTFQS